LTLLLSLWELLRCLTLTMSMTLTVVIWLPSRSIQILLAQVFLADVPGGVLFVWPVFVFVLAPVLCAADGNLNSDLESLPLLQF
jgi:hypothetical protein